MQYNCKRFTFHIHCHFSTRVARRTRNWFHRKVAIFHSRLNRPCTWYASLNVKVFASRTFRNRKHTSERKEFMYKGESCASVLARGVLFSFIFPFNGCHHIVISILSYSAQPEIAIEFLTTMPSVSRLRYIAACRYFATRGREFVYLE